MLSLKHELFHAQSQAWIISSSVTGTCCILLSHKLQLITSCSVIHTNYFLHSHKHKLLVSRHKKKVYIPIQAYTLIKCVLCMLFHILWIFWLEVCHDSQCTHPTSTHQKKCLPQLSSHCSISSMISSQFKLTLSWSNV